MKASGEREREEVRRKVEKGKKEGREDIL